MQGLGAGIWIWLGSAKWRSAAAASWEERKPESLPSQQQQPPRRYAFIHPTTLPAAKTTILSLYACKEDIDLEVFTLY
ncbi:hypothetical protein DdX_14665 [Ditylenchus destructor]|uniref:Secreted protein n=1 Tax=Ditylenchus destructor TaxID=166010 RepID=A0AAD4MU31_9BILA|nr:hypothetical protein DdX_14665 [Ditylenchus destructor]